jgi:hypothetical protein
MPNRSSKHQTSDPNPIAFKALQHVTDSGDTPAKARPRSSWGGAVD